MDFRCYYCHSDHELFEDVINHAVSAHGDNELKIRVLTLNSQTGKRSYVRTDFKVVPSVLQKEGKTVIGKANKKIEIVFEANKINCPELSNEEVDTSNQCKGIDEELKKLHELLPDVAKKLDQSGHLQTWIQFHELVARDVFPLDNIAFKLFMDVVRFFSSPFTTSMRYSDDVKQFWRMGYKLFHGKFLRFMGGPKHQGQNSDSNSADNKLDPLDAKINFAVPTTKCLETPAIVSDEMKPGIIQECLKSVAKHCKQVKVSFDGKKINGSLSERHGDVNLFGCEVSPTYAELNGRKEKDLQLLTDMRERAESGTLSHADIQATVQMLSLRIKNLREMACFKEQGVKKFKSLGQPDWRTSKYAFVISSLQSSLFEIGVTIRDSLDTTDRLCQIAAKFQGVGNFYCPGSTRLDLSQQPNYICVEGSTSEHHEEIAENPQLTRHVLKQRSPSWHAVRSSGKLTGSSAHKALGLHSFKEQVSYFDEKFNEKAPPERSDLLKNQLEHGVQNEVNALATLLGKVLPAYYPNLAYVEEGCTVLKKDGKSFLVVSPDGSGRTEARKPACLAFEFKCPYYLKSFVPQVQYKIPHYYVVQLLCEMTALQCTTMLFLSYTAESTTVFRVLYSEDLWKRIWAEMELLYDSEHPKRPSKLSKNVQALREQLKTFVAEKTEFLGEIPSLTGKPCEHEALCAIPSFQDHKQLTQVQPTECDELQAQCQTLHKAQACVNESFNLCRRRATEIFMFMMSDLHRRSRSDSIPSLPVAYGLQGSSLNTATARKMLLKVLASAEDHDLDVISFSCDGQFIKLVTHDAKGKPLTQLQHQKSFYEDVKKMSKQTLLQHFSDLKLKSDRIEEECSVASLADVAVKRRHLKLMSQKGKKKPLHDKLEEDADSVSNAISVLPEDLGEKVDEGTYKEILSVVQGLISAKQTEDTPQEDVLQDRLREAQVLPETGGNLNKCTITLDYCSLQTILSALQSDGEEKTQEKWKRMDVKDIEELLQAGVDLDKALCKLEVKTCLKTIKQMFSHETKHIRLTCPKWKLIQDLQHLLGWEADVPKTKRSQKCQSLKDLALKGAQKLPKTVLCAIYAEMMYPEEEKKWRESFPFSQMSTVNEEVTLVWNSYPEVRTFETGRQLPLLGIVDSHHILTNLRTKCCKTGIPEAGIHREAWVRVASQNRENKTGLTLAHVDDLIDRQRNSFAQLTFSEAVEEEMRKNNDHTEADFCRLIRLWYKADDDAGVDCHVRLQWRLALRSWLCNRYNLQHFSPPTSYVGGIPIVTFESLLTNIERKIQMYSFAAGESFNARSLTTLDAENFFSVLGDLTPGGNGLAIRPSEIPGALKTACEISLLQIDTDKSFHMHTSKAPVYPKMELCASASNIESPQCTAMSETTALSDMSSIQTRNHEFDLASRGKRKGKRKSSNVSGPHQPSKGAKGVRQYHKVDESKILPHRRLGIEIDD